MFDPENQKAAVVEPEVVVAPVVEPATVEPAAVAPELNYRVCAGGPYTQYDAEGKANVFRIGDTIKLTEEAAVAHGEGCFELLG